MKLTYEQKLEIASLFEQGKTGREIAKQYGISEGLASTIKKDFYFKKPSVKQRELNRSRIKKSKQMQEKALTKIVNEKSELFVKDVLDQNRAIKFAVEEAIEILNDMKSIKAELKPLLEIIVSNLSEKEIFDSTETLELRGNLQEAIYKISNIYSQSSIKLGALNTVKNLIESSIKITNKIDFVKYAEDLLSAYFNALNVLPENYYEAVKRKALELHPVAHTHFSFWDSTEILDDAEEL
jgi:IS30 family transposase